MTWQLMKRDRMWQAATAMTAVIFAVVAVASWRLPLPPNAATREAFRTGAAVFLGLYLTVVLWLASIVQASREVHQAALPIPGRDGWLARVLSLLSLVWLPVLTGIACELPPSPLLAAGAIYTVLVLAAKCFRIQSLGVGQKLRKYMFQIMVLGPLIATQLSKLFKSTGLFKEVHWPALPPMGAVLAICGVASLALFQWGWNNVPKSFQFAAPGLGVVLQSEASHVKLAEFIWTPLFRSLYGRGLAIMAAFILGLMPFGLFAAGIFAAIPQAGIRSRCRWLLALPVSPRQLFGLIAAPPGVLTILGAWGQIFFDTKHPLTPRVRFVELGAQLAFVYLAIFLNELPAWRPLSKVRAWMRWVPFGLAFLAGAVAFSNPDNFKNLAMALPANWWQLGGILAIPVVASYWLAEKAFREQEYRRPYVESVNASNEMRRDSR